MLIDVPGSLPGGPPSAVAHYTFAAFSAVAVATTLAIAGGALLAGRPAQPWLDRLILLQSALVIAAALTGVPGPFGGHGPSDPLHYLYAVLAVVTFPVARYLGRRSDKATARWVAFACLVQAGLLLRLWMTGGQG